MGTERQVPVARELALKLKRALREQVGECLTCSEQRLHRAGILTVAELWNATPLRLRRVWGGINGVLFHQMLHGVDIQPPSSRFSKSIGHQHVLEPELRTKKGAHDFAQHLLTKAAERLRLSFRMWPSTWWGQTPGRTRDKRRNSSWAAARPRI
jgi:nucleotidyltransferase/DNA polymerase involved in DNA repair